MFKHLERACRGIRNGAGCRKEIRQLHDRCRRRSGGPWGGWTPHRAAINNMLSAAARSKKSNTPHQSRRWIARARAGWCFGATWSAWPARAIKLTKVLKSLERLLAKGPGYQDEVEATHLKFLREGWPGVSRIKLFRASLNVSLDFFGTGLNGE